MKIPLDVACEAFPEVREAVDQHFIDTCDEVLSDYWKDVEKTLRSVSRDAFQREVLGTFVTYDIDQFETVKHASSGNDYGPCDNCKEEKPLALHLCTRRDKTTDHRLYCRKCVRNRHEHQH